MTPRMRRLIASAGMLAVAVALTLLLAADEDAPPTSTRAGGNPVVRATGPHRMLPPATSFAAIAQRPLFLPSRRPEPEAPPLPTPAERPAQPAAPPTLSATLVGVLLSPVGRSVIVRLSDGKTATIPEGGTIQGWTLTQVSPDGVSFVSGAASIDLAFPMHQAGPTPGAAYGQSVADVAVRRRR